MRTGKFFLISAVAASLVALSVATAGATERGSVSLSPGSTVTIEGNTDHVVDLTVTLQGNRLNTKRAVRVGWTTSTSGVLHPATRGVDFTPASGHVLIAPGATTATFPITIKGDATPEPDEFFVVRLLSSDNGTVADHGHVALIIVHNDDAGPPPTHDITAQATICIDSPDSAVKWTAADGGGPIEGYTVTVTDTSDGSTISQQVPSWQTYAFFYNVNPRTSPGPWTATVAVNSSNWPFPPLTVPMPVVACTF